MVTHPKTCPQCKFSSESKRTLYYHIKNGKHSPDTLDLGQPAPKHRRMSVLEGIEIACLICKHPVLSNTQMIDHLNQKHKTGNEFVCKNCQHYKSTSATEFQNHLKSCLKPPKLGNRAQSSKCYHCSTQFPSVKLMLEHAEANHKDENGKLHCPVDACDTKFTNGATLRSHITHKHPKMPLPVIKDA